MRSKNRINFSDNEIIIYTIEKQFAQIIIRRTSPIKKNWIDENLETNEWISIEVLLIQMDGFGVTEKEKWKLYLFLESGLCKTVTDIDVWWEKKREK